MNDDDRSLRELFARLKHEDRGRTPSFRTPERHVRTQVAWVPRVAMAAAIVLVAIVLARPDRPSRNAPVVDLGAATWRSPTDFLLATPGAELMRTVPVFGSPDHWPPIDLPSRSPVPESTRS
jgi:hypothetical protein